MADDFAGRRRRSVPWYPGYAMARQQYPLEALRKLRDDRAGEQAGRLAVQVARSQGALSALRGREALRREHAEQTGESMRAERERLALVGASGSELLRLADFAVVTRGQAELLERLEAEARQVLAVERAAEDKLRQELSALEADAKLVRNHETGFHELQADLAQKADEEAALEQWNARQR